MSRSGIARSDSQFSTETRSITNARTRIVGTRTGFLADAIVALVRASRAVARAASVAFARVASVVTPLGWTLGALAPVLLFLGYTLGLLELVVVGYTAIVLIAIAALFLIGRSRLTVSIVLPSQRFVVGELATASVRVANPARSRSLSTTMEIPVGTGIAEVVIPALKRGQSAELPFVVPTARRGIVLVGPVRSVRADPIGLVRREVSWPDEREVFVHPVTLPIPSMSTGLIRDLEGNPTRDLSSSDVSFHALREYLPGDERRNIHWKSTAKTGTYMVRQFEETRRSHLVIALSLAASDFATPLEFELAVSAVGSLGARAIRDARELSVIVSESTPEFAVRKVLAVKPLSTLTRTRLLDELCTVDPDPSALELVDVARVAGDQVPGISVAFLVCGSTVTTTRLREAAAKFPIGVEVVAVVCDPDASPGMRRLTGLTVLSVGFLDDLQQSLARVVTS